MDLDEMISNSLRYPLQDIGKLLLLFLLMLGSFTIILLPFFYGYLLRIIEHTTHGYDELPAFNEWGKMFGDGVKYIFADIIYLIIPVILIIISLFGFIGFARHEITGTVFLVWVIVGIVGLVLYIILSLMFIMALSNMAYDERFSSTFKFTKIWGLIKGIGLIKYFVYIVVVGIIAFIIDGLIPNIITIPIRSLGFTGFYLIILIISLPFSLYVAVYRSRFYGLIYLLGLEEEHGTEFNSEIE